MTTKLDLHLCYKYDEKYITEGKDYLIQRKLDGVRVLFHKGKLLTRNGFEINYPSLIRVLPSKLTIDGELIYKGGLIEHRSKISGLVNSAIHGGKITDDNVAFVPFDLISNYDDKGEVLELYDRVRRLAVSIDNNRFVNRGALKSQRVSSKQEINDYFNDYIEQGGEGVIVKDLESTYMFKRHKSWLKLKVSKITTLKCVDIKEGTGKYERMVGSLECEGYMDGQLVKCSVGTGLNDSMRSKNWDYYLNKDIVIRYNSVSTNSTKEEITFSLFLPVFIQVK